MSIDTLFAVVPLIPSVVILWFLRDSPLMSKIMMSIVVAGFGFVCTDKLVPVIGQLTLKRGMSGKDLGKKGTQLETKDIPEALGIVPGVIFLMCAILSQLLFASSMSQLTISNSALFSVCFMIFLGFVDDTLELQWRYKLVLPTIASLPLLVAYSGSTAMYIPEPFRWLLMSGESLTSLGRVIDIFATVDMNAEGAIVDLGYFFLLFMGMLAVFCSNAINILAGINGLECGQAYVIACSILCFKLYDLLVIGNSMGVPLSTGALDSESNAYVGEHQLFAIFLILPFVGTSLGLLRHNWFPAAVFVGDTYCYFAGMTFAVLGIHGHFSKTLLLLFLPQVFNFIYSLPQLFKVIPCPRHRLPRANPDTHLLHCSTFPCKEHEYKLFKMHPHDIVCPNLTLICVVLRVCGPLPERLLCLVLLGIQLCSAGLAFYIRYVLLG